MIQDIHSHSYYSFCGNDDPSVMVETAIAAGIEVYGICDHNYGICYGRRSIFKCDSEIPEEDYEKTLIRYYDHISLLREKYKDSIRLLCGVEVCTSLLRSRVALPRQTDISFFDYCLIENVDLFENSVTGGDLIGYAKSLGCPAGVAHTDLFKFIQKRGDDPYDYLCRMADAGIFWEMNVNYDATHRYIEHQYVKDFFASEEQQELVRRSGLRLSVGFDCHRASEYLGERVINACQKLEEIKIPTVNFVR
ncbi:MAG: PHP domain-containing protein [Ruminococcaceae bacterium]|nr:PHP domain-containing protein [Oscillospiraceae bacterium]